MNHAKGRGGGGGWGEGGCQTICFTSGNCWQNFAARRKLDMLNHKLEKHRHPTKCKHRLGCFSCMPCLRPKFRDCIGTAVTCSSNFFSSASSCACRERHVSKLSTCATCTSGASGHAWGHVANVSQTGPGSPNSASPRVDPAPHVPCDAAAPGPRNVTKDSLEDSIVCARQSGVHVALVPYSFLILACLPAPPPAKAALGLKHGISCFNGLC